MTGCIRGSGRLEPRRGDRRPQIRNSGIGSADWRRPGSRRPEVRWRPRGRRWPGIPRRRRLRRAKERRRHHGRAASRRTATRRAVAGRSSRGKRRQRIRESDDARLCYSRPPSSSSPRSRAPRRCAFQPPPSLAVYCLREEDGGSGAASRWRWGTGRRQSDS